MRHVLVRVATHGVRFFAQGRAYCGTETFVHQELPRMRAYREEAVRELVLALRTGLEALQALRYRVFGAEAVAQLGSPPAIA